MQSHLARNGLAEASGIKSSVVFGAAWKFDTTVRFGVVQNTNDYGAAATDKAGDTDYRGNKVAFVELPAYSLSTICKDLKHVDCMHWDIQGAEWEFAEASIQFLTERVRYIYIGTHSPAIYGKLIELFFEAGWDLMFHTYPAFAFDGTKSALEAMVAVDGELAFRNTSRHH